MIKKKARIILIILIIFILSLATGSILVWQQLTIPRQSSIRLTYQLKLKQLLIAIDSFQESYKKLPKNLVELKSAGKIPDISQFDHFKYVGGLNDILAFQKKPFLQVRKGEPWGGLGEIAKCDISSARLVLFSDGSIKFIDEADFLEKYNLLMLSSSSENDKAPEINTSIDHSDAAFEELVPGLIWSKWYRETSGYSPDPKQFGAYVTLPVGNDLYIGFGTGPPTRGDGALITRFDGKNIEAIGSLAEEGVHEMIWDDRTGTLHIAGTDPSWPDDWNAGNHYTYVPSYLPGITKHRDPENGLVNVIHTWGLWMSKNHELYAAVNSQDGKFTRDMNLPRRIFYRIRRIFDHLYHFGVTRIGQIFKSTDNGVNWQHVSDIGYFRAYDIIGFNDKLYTVYIDKPELPFKLAVSEDNAKNWKDVTQKYIRHSSLTLFQDKLLAISYDGKSIYSIRADTLSTNRLPEGFEFADNYNILAVGNNHLYCICKDENDTYVILRTQDLYKWEHVVCTDKKLISLSCWQTKNWLVASGTGIQAKLWKIDIHQAEVELISGKKL